jgi:hypothetical protein
MLCHLGCDTKENAVVHLFFQFAPELLVVGPEDLHVDVDFVEDVIELAGFRSGVDVRHPEVEKN